MHPTTTAVVILAVVLILQAAPLVHFFRVRKLSPCLRSSYCLLYIMLAAMAWMGFAVLQELTRVGWVWLLPLLGLPIAFWGYLAATNFRASGDGTSCPVR